VTSEFSDFKNSQEDFMLRAAIAFFILGLIAIVFGATGFAGLSIEIGKTLLFVFLVLAAISFIASLVMGRNNKLPH
jgi:uncharacterized membrane protein YtjA (UPF0391 family)